MANKKLKVELELETAKAKRQAKELEQTTGGGGGGGGSGGGGVSGGSDKLSRSLDKAAKSAEKSAGAFDQMQGRAAQLTKGFAGIAVGMATSYASNYVTNPNAKAGLDYAGAGISGAVGGAMMAGLPGAIVGGLAGVLKTYMDKQGELSAMRKDFETGEDDYENNRLWQAKMRGLSEIDYSPVNLKGADLTRDKIGKTDERLEAVKKLAVKLFEEQNDLVKKINEHLKAGEKEEAEKLQKELSITRSKKEQAEDLERSYAKQKKSLEHQLEQEEYDEKNKGATGVAYYAGTDSLARVGGGGGGAPASADAGDVAGPASIGSRVRSFGFSVPVAKSAFTSFGNADLSFGDASAQAIKDGNALIEKIDRDQLKLLEEIARNTSKQGGSSWQ